MSLQTWPKQVVLSFALALVVHVFRLDRTAVGSCRRLRSVVDACPRYITPAKQ